MSQTFVQIGQKYFNLAQVAFADFEPGNGLPPASAPKADATPSPAPTRHGARLRLFYSTESHVTLQDDDAMRVKTILDRLLIGQAPQ